MSYRPVLAALLLAAALPAIPALAADTSVTIDNFTFTPERITVPAGAHVVWTNRDDMPHTVTDAADAKAFRSAPLDTGESFSFTFAHPGIYHYFCSLHPHMEGTVIVR